MTGRWTIGDYEFRTAADYAAAIRDDKIIGDIKRKYDLDSGEDILRVFAEIDSGRIRFGSRLGRDFEDELYDKAQKIKERQAQGSGKRAGKTGGGKKQKGNAKGETGKEKKSGREALRDPSGRRLLGRSIVMGVCSLLAAGCLGYFTYYCFMQTRTETDVTDLASLIDENAKEKVKKPGESNKEPEILGKYEALYKQNRNLIGWLYIADTKIDYPVMHSGNGEYYLDHNFNQEYDKNGTLFLDDKCDVLRPSDNLIVYGHNMKSGEMFGSLKKYADKSYYEKHKTILFDTIYEIGTYEVMSVFKSRVFYEGEITFKYYQFIDASSKQEFDSAVSEMKKMSLYDTGVTAQYGDRLLTLSTCDYEEEDGRFVVVARRKY